MKKRKWPIVLLVLLIVVGILFGGAYAALKTTKDIGVSWTEQDYQSFAGKVGRQLPMTGEYNLIALSKGVLTCEGKRELDVSLNNEEVSSVLSKENGEFGPVKDVKVRFLGNNEGEATFKLTEKFMEYVSLDSYGIADNNLVKAAISGTPVYVRVKLDMASPKSVQADFENIAIGRIPLSQDIVQKVENEAVPLVNSILAKYDNFEMQELRLDEGSLYYKGTAPDQVKVGN